MTNSARKANLANRSGLIKMIWMGKTTKKTKMAKKAMLAKWQKVPQSAKMASTEKARKS